MQIFTFIEAVGRELSLALVEYLLNAYKTNPRIKQLLDSIDLHILHSMNPDGFEKASQVCTGLDGRYNAHRVRFVFYF